MTMKSQNKLSAIAAAFLLASCSTAIGLKTDFQQAKFEVNKSTKKDVVNYLGLPQKMVKDPNGRDHYIYEGATRLVGACIGCGNVNGSVGLIPSYINQSQVQSGAEYVFDEKGILVAKFEPK
jgi:hypothetical protein